MAEVLQDLSDPLVCQPDWVEDPKVPRRKKLKLFLCTHWRGLVCLITPLILIPVLAPFPPEKYQWCGYTLIIMAIFWVTECIPLPVTSFFPVVIFPLTDVMDTRTTCKCYMNDTILIFFGSMVLAYAVEQSGLHQRLALWSIRIIGYSHYRLIIDIVNTVHNPREIGVLHKAGASIGMAFSSVYLCPLTTMFVSMWITNTAATTMMVPINFALLEVFENQNLLKIYDIDSNGDMIASDITTCYFCAASFSATIGGIGTLVGTATNLVFKGLFQSTYPSAPEYLSFPKFSAFSIPYMLLLEMGVYFYLIVVYLGYLRPKSQAAQTAKVSEAGVIAARNAVEEKWKKNGKVTFWEIMVIILFSGAMLLFFCRSPQIFYGWGDYISDYYKLNNYKFIRDSAAAFFICFLMVLLPSTLDFFSNFTAKDDELPDKPIPSVLNWSVMNEIMPYSFMFLLGGGFALSDAAKPEYSDLNGRIGDVLKNLSIFPNYFIILLIVIFTVIVTNFASNVCVCNVVTPIVMQLAVEMNIHPLWYNIASGISASYCFCLPVGTPGNLVIQSAAKIPTMKMIKAGAGPTVTTIFLSWICFCFWAPVIWPDLNKNAEEINWII